MPWTTVRGVEVVRSKWTKVLNTLATMDNSEKVNELRPARKFYLKYWESVLSFFLGFEPRAQGKPGISSGHLGESVGRTEKKKQNSGKRARGKR